MIELDGSEGEGGGQILRTALGLAASTGQAFRIEGIRANRSRPGLAAQHLAAAQCAGKLCDARMEGAHLGSQTLVFEPRKAPSGDHVVHVGTAGSATLVLQAGFLASARAEGRVRLEVHGGTDVPLSPPASYYRLVLVPLLCRMGLDMKMDLVQRGFYPEGGGVVVATVSAPPSVDPLDLRARGSLREVGGVAFSRNLPEHVARRMASECRRRLVDVPTVRIELDQGDGPSTGAGVVLAARSENGLVGASCRGERGVSAERVAELAVQGLRAELCASLDVHAADQLLPFMALASGPSHFTVRAVSDHLRTQMSTVACFLPVSFEERGADPVSVSVLPNRT
jgi:RNA 3'-phosphate cyclase